MFRYDDDGDADGCTCGVGPPGDPNCPSHGGQQVPEPRTESVIPCAQCGKLFMVRHDRGEAWVQHEQAVLESAVADHERTCTDPMGPLFATTVFTLVPVP